MPGPHLRPTFFVRGRDFGVTLGRLFFLYSVHIWAIPECFQVYQELLKPSPAPTSITISTTLPPARRNAYGARGSSAIKKKKKKIGSQPKI